MLGFFYRIIRSQTGGFLIGTFLVTGLIALGTGLYQLSKKAEQANENRIDVTKYGDIQASGDPGKDQEKNSAGLVQIAVDGGETAVGVYDDTGLLLIMDKSGVFKAGSDSEDETESDDSIRSELEEKELPSDKLMVDTAKVIKKQVEKRATTDTTDEEVGELVYEIMEDIDEDIEALGLDESQDDDFSGIDDFKVIEELDKILDTIGKLEDKETIELRKKLSRLESEKKYLEQKIASCNQYGNMGYTITSYTGITDLENRLDGVNEKIADISQQLGLGNLEFTKVTLTGNGDLRGFYEGTNITLNIDLKTGVVTGHITAYGHQPYYDEDQSVTCKYKFDSELSGSIDLGTYDLSVKASGYVTSISGGVCSGLKDTQYSTTLKGKLNEAATHISGTSSMGGSWSASR